MGELTNGDLLALIGPAPARETEVDPDGWVVDVASGEVLGRADVDEAYAVDSAEKADWVLMLRSQIEGDIAGIDARIRAVNEQLQALRRQKVRRLAWWDWKFAPGLIDFARSCLSGRSRTARFGWGSVSFRATRGSNAIVDMASAVGWMKVWKPEAVRVAETVTVKDLLEARELARRSTGEDEPLPFLASSGPSESATIATGVEIGGAR